MSPIEDADLIEKATVDGWDVVVSKGTYQTGDLGVFFEIDSALPIQGIFEFLSGRSVKTVGTRRCHVLKTIRLRKVLSQGLLMTPAELGLLDELKAGDDLTQWAQDTLGVTKYEPPLPSVVGGDAAGVFPTLYARKTDAERIQNIAECWEELLKYEWVATEKIDGTSATFVQTEDGIVACSRNWAIKEGDNLYWDVAKQYDLKTLMPLGAVLQGEIYGEGINGNRLGLKGRHFAAFNIEPVDSVYWEEGIPVVPHYRKMSLPETIGEAISQADGIKSLMSPGRLAEGIVWRNYQNKGFQCLDGRPIFKVVSNKYLLKEKD